MKNIKKVFVFLICFQTTAILAQETETVLTENYGGVLNVSAGIGYYNYVRNQIPVVHLDYEIQIGENITMAPSVSVYEYSGKHIWINEEGFYRNYTYTETVVPIGVKVHCYFDKLFHAGSKWDFYSAGSLGFIIRKTEWESEYKGKRNIEPGTGLLYMDLHVGSEYHLSKRIGLHLDVSTGVSTFGISIHL